MDTPIVAVATDASFDLDNLLTAYAYYIELPQHVIKSGGIAKRVARSSTEAELIAIGNALYILKQCKKPEKFKLHLYVDNRGALLHADPTYEIHTRTARKFQRNNQDLVYYCRRELLAYDFEVHYVRAHMKLKRRKTQHHMNDWCDKESRKLMREARSLLNNE